MGFLEEKTEKNDKIFHFLPKKMGFWLVFGLFFAIFSISIAVFASKMLDSNNFLKNVTVFDKGDAYNITFERRKMSNLSISLPKTGGSGGSGGNFSGWEYENGTVFTPFFTKIGEKTEEKVSFFEVYPKNHSVFLGEYDPNINISYLYDEDCEVFSYFTAFGYPFRVAITPYKILYGMYFYDDTYVSEYFYDDASERCYSVNVSWSPRDGADGYFIQYDDENEFDLFTNFGSYLPNVTNIIIECYSEYYACLSNYGGYKEYASYPITGKRALSGYFDNGIVVKGDSRFFNSSVAVYGGFSAVASESTFDEFYEFQNPVIVLDGARKSVKLGAPLNITPGYFSTSVGYGGYSAYYSTAIGYMTNASGAYSTSIGVQQSIYGTEAVGVGIKNNVPAHNSMAFGKENFIPSAFSIAVGHSNNVSSSNSLAIGYSNNVSSLNSQAIGRANRIVSTAFDNYIFGVLSNIIGGTTSFIIGIGNDANSTVGANYIFGRYNALNGSTNIIIGQFSNLLRFTNNSLAIGISNTINGAFESIIIGNGVTTNTSRSILIGSSITNFQTPPRNNEFQSVGIGGRLRLFNYSSAIGNFIENRGNNSLAIGSGPFRTSSTTAVWTNTFNDSLVFKFQNGTSAETDRYALRIANNVIDIGGANNNYNLTIDNTFVGLNRVVQVRGVSGDCNLTFRSGILVNVSGGC